MSRFSTLSAPALSPEQLEQARARLEDLYGLLKANWAGFVEREGQVTLMQAALETLLSAKSATYTPPLGANMAALEAGTGTGKTIAYCLAAIVASELLPGFKVVVSTATVALQEQLVLKDLPRLASFIPTLSFELVKGRSRYVCKSRLEQAIEGDIQSDWMDDLPMDDDESAPAPAARRDVDEKTMVWLKSMNTALDRGTWDGDRDNMGTLSDDAQWKTVQADGNACQRSRCAHYKDCAFFVARKRSQTVTIQVANHALVLSALANESTMFDVEKTLFVFDEAHHLPDIANDQFHHTARLGLSQKVLVAVRRSMMAGSRTLDRAQRPDLAEIGRMEQAAKEVLRRLQDFAGESNILTPEVPLYRYPHGEIPEDLTLECHNLALVLESIRSKAIDLKTLLAVDDESLSPADRNARQKAANDLGPHLHRLSGIAALFKAWATHQEIPLAKWMSLTQNGTNTDIELCASPLTGAQGLHKDLWSHVGAAVCTSATLSACGSFDFFQRLSGLNRYPGLRSGVMKSPFDYPKQARLQLPKLRNNPKSMGFSSEFNTVLPDLLSDHLAGQLVIFTSRRQMESSYAALPDALRERVLMQGTMNRQSLLAEHRKRVEAGEMSILFGLQSMGEGLDLPGALCEHVLIDKLPFVPPTSPVEEALSEWLESKNRDAFAEIAVPRTAMRLAQWVGRAVRTVTDQATITVCDTRLSSTGYGRRILQGLPAFAR